MLTAAAFCYQRQRLGEAPLRRLMREACVPLCQPQTPGAFHFGLRLIALDSKLFDVSETAETDWTFRGRTPEDQPRHNSPFPQLRLLSALEIGSHAHVAAVVAAGSRSEMALVNDLLPFLPQHSLVLADSGFRGAWWLQRLQQHGHHSITRLHANDLSCPGPRLQDGSSLVQARGSSSFPLPTPLTLRVVEYQLDERISQPLSQLRRSRARSSTRASGQGPQIYRLATTLLDPLQAPALEIAACYEERWEVELVYDELQEHQQVAERLQSHTALTARQELWAMLLGHYALRAWMMRSANQAGLDVDRLSLTQAITVLSTALTLSGPLQWAEASQWDQILLCDLRQHDTVRAPVRRLRCFPRVIKMASSRFFVKGPQDHPFHFPEDLSSWKACIRMLHVPAAPPSPPPSEILLI